jgi:tetratricopeptide (TPR) repeat protein
MLGVIWHDRGKLDEARGAFERALSMSPSYTEAALNLSVTLNDLGQYTRARDIYTRVIQRARAAPRSLDPYVKGKLANMHADSRRRLLRERPARRGDPRIRQGARAVSGVHRPSGRAWRR